MVISLCTDVGDVLSDNRKTHAPSWARSASFAASVKLDRKEHHSAQENQPPALESNPDLDAPSPWSGTRSGPEQLALRRAPRQNHRTGNARVGVGIVARVSQKLYG